MGFKLRVFERLELQLKFPPLGLSLPINVVAEITLACKLALPDVPTERKMDIFN